jgi:hypothetical protein
VLLTGIGLVILALIALIMYTRSVDPIEVVGTLLFIPVFLGLMFWGLPGGVILGVAAAAGYAALRSPAIAAVGAGRFIGLILGRAAGYIAFGGIGGWAAAQLRASMDKLDLYDQIDDATGMLNVRALLHAIDMERSRAVRYEKVFSISILEIPVSLFDRLRKRRRDVLLRDLGRYVSSGIRGADSAGHAVESDRHLLIMVLPETGREGAGSFTQALEEKLGKWIEQRVSGHATLTGSSSTFPDDDLVALVSRLRDLETEQQTV